jgi:hypothetical protein
MTRDWVCYVTCGGATCELTVSRTLPKSPTHTWNFPETDHRFSFISDTTSNRQPWKEDSTNLAGCFRRCLSGVFGRMFEWYFLVPESKPFHLHFQTLSYFPTQHWLQLFFPFQRMELLCLAGHSSYNCLLLLVLFSQFEHKSLFICP